MDNILLSLWTESLVPGELLAEPCSFQNAACETRSTTNVCAHGTHVFARTPLAPNQNVFVRSASSKLSLPEYVVHCKPVPDRSYTVRLELLQPPANWPAADELFDAPITH